MIEKISYKDLYQFHFISDVVLSEDGAQAIFTETVADEKTNAYQSRLWLLDPDSGRRQLLTPKEGLSMAVWLNRRTVLFAAKDADSPDAGNPGNGTHDTGSQNPGHTVFYAIPTDGGEARRFMDVPCKVTGLVPLGGELFLIRGDRGEQMENDEDCFVADELPWWFNGKGMVNKKRCGLWLGEKKGGNCALTPLTPPLMDVLSVAVSPDKKMFAYSGELYKDMRRHETSLWLYTLEDGRARPMVPGTEGGTPGAPPTTEEAGSVLTGGELSDLCFMGNDRLFFTKHTYEWAGRSPHMMCLELPLGQIVPWPFYDREIQNSVGSDAKYGGGKTVAYDQGILYYVEANETDSFVAMMDANGQRSYVNQMPGAVTGIAAAGGRLLLTAMRGQKLAEVYAVDVADGRERQLTDFNEAYIKTHRVVAPESFTYDSENGYTMKGFVLYPAEYAPGRKYPVILSMHGGPKVVYGSVFHHEMQCQANDGYFVIYTNPRGSDGRGEAFADLTGGLGGPDFDDFMEFVDEALSRYPDMDEKHIGICGGSYGGFMCNWMIGHTDRFAAAVSQRSISNYMTKLLCTDIGYYHNKLQIGAFPWEDFETLWEHSPLKKGMYAKTPTLFLQSDEDYRCYMSDALQLFSALKRQGCDTRMILFHGENHELSRSGKPHNRITRLEEMQKWFEKYLHGGYYGR